MIGDTYRRMLDESRSPDVNEENAIKFRYLCDKIDQVQAENRDLKGQVEQLGMMLHDEAPKITRFAQFLQEWNERSPYNTKSKLNLIADRVQGYDKNFAEVHKRFDEWDKLSERITKATAQFEALFIKGEEGT